MNSFTIELISNSSSELFPNITLSYFTNFLPEQVNLEGQWEVAVSEISYSSMYQNVAKGKFFFMTMKHQKQMITTISNQDYIILLLT